LQIGDKEYRVTTGKKLNKEPKTKKCKPTDRRKNKMKNQLLKFSLIAVALWVNQGQSATTFTGSFDLTTAAANNFEYNGPSITDVTVSNLNGVGVTYSGGTGRLVFSSWSTGATSGSNTFTGAINLSKYIEFSLTAAAGTTIDMTSLDFGIRRSATGTRQFEVRSSVDGYGSALSNYTTLNASLLNSSGVLTNPDSSSTTSYGPSNNLNLSSLTGLSSVTFRFYFYNSESTTGTGGIQGPITFTGTAVPEPSSSMLMVVGMVALVAVRSLRRGRGNS
jgi:hypothetical protein